MAENTNLDVNLYLGKKSVLTNASTFKKFVNFLSSLNPRLFLLRAETDAKTSDSLKTLIRSHNQKTSLHSFQLAEFLNFKQNLHKWTAPKNRRKRWPPRGFFVFFFLIYTMPLYKKSCRKKTENDKNITFKKIEV